MTGIWVRAGYHEAGLDGAAIGVALVMGVELGKTVPGGPAARYLGAAAWAGTLNFGGSTATTVSFVVGRAAL